jgi:hypothetical protein
MWSPPYWVLAVPPSLLVFNNKESHYFLYPLPILLFLILLQRISSSFRFPFFVSLFLFLLFALQSRSTIQFSGLTSSLTSFISLSQLHLLCSRSSLSSSSLSSRLSLLYPLIQSSWLFYLPPSFFPYPFSFLFSSFPTIFVNIS